MPDPERRRAPALRRFAAQVVLGACGLGAVVWAVHGALLWGVPYEEQADPVLFWLYKRTGWGLGITVGVIAVLAALHLRVFGREDMRPRGPRDVVRWWHLGERITHWALVGSFALLLVTGLQLYHAGFGLPTPLTRFMRRWHVGEPFWVAGTVVFLMWVRDAWPRRYDLRWLAHGGGHFGHHGALPAGRFNAGQKLWFWLELLAGVVMAASGYELQHHFTRFDDGYLTLLAAHLGAAWIFLAVVAVHFYLAVIGVRGALAGMILGRVGRLGAQRLHPEAEALRRPETG